MYNAAELMSSLVPRPIRAMRVSGGGLEPSAIVRRPPRRIFLPSSWGDVTFDAEDDWERGWVKYLGPVVQRVDNAIQQIIRYPGDK